MATSMVIATSLTTKPTASMTTTSIAQTAMSASVTTAATTSTVVIYLVFCLNPLTIL